MARPRTGRPGTGSNDRRRDPGPRGRRLERHPDGHYAKPEGGIWKPRKRKLKGHNKGDVYELRRLELASVAAYLDPHIRLYRVTRDGRKVARWP